MATQQEILNKYLQDKREKILIFTATLNSRMAFQARSTAAKLDNGSSIINTITSVNPQAYDGNEDLYYSDIAKSSFSYGSEIRKKTRDWATSWLSVDRSGDDDVPITEPIAFVVVQCEIRVDDNRESTIKEKGGPMVVLTVDETLYLKKPGDKKAKTISSEGPISQDTMYFKSFEDMNKYYSVIPYSTYLLNRNQKFNKYLKDLIEPLDSTAGGPIIDRLSIVTVTTVDIPDFNPIFPRPLGLEAPPEIPPTPLGTSGTSGTSGIGGTGTSGTSGVTPPEVTQPATPPVTTEGTVGTAGTSGVTETTGTPGVDTPDTEKRGGGGDNVNPNGVKYLSIEAIKDDDPFFLVPEDQIQTGSNISVISTRFIRDEDIDKYYSESEIKTIQTETITTKQNSQPLGTPKGDTNPEVIKKEKEEIEKRTEAQKKLEQADAIAPEKAKDKSQSGPAGSNPGSPDGKKAAQEEKSGPIPEDKKPEKKAPFKPSTALTFLAWAAKDGFDPNGIIYRGTRPYDYKKEPTPKPPITYGITKPERFKNLFNFGDDLDKIFDGYTVESPIDVALLMNSGGVGRFNKNWPYMFGEGSEIHAAMTRKANIEKLGSGGFGNYGAGRDFYDANWASNPFWCGFCTNFMLYANGKYVSDLESLQIEGTPRVERYYTTSPFNPENSEKEKKKQINTINGNIETKEITKASQEKILNTKQKERDAIQLKIDKRTDELLADTTLTGGDPNNPAITNDKTIRNQRVLLNGHNKEIENLEKSISQLNTDIENLKKEKEQIQNQPDGKYFEANVVAKFSFGTHWDKTGLKTEGRELYEKIKMWPGAYIVRRDKGNSSGHVETLLHFSPSGELYTIGGNTGLENSDGNGSEYGFKKYNGILQFNGSAEYFYVVKRGTSKPYTNGIGISVKQTKMYEKYVDGLDISNPNGKPKDTELNTAAYNILRNIMEIKK